MALTSQRQEAARAFLEEYEATCRRHGFVILASYEGGLHVADLRRARHPPNLDIALGELRGSLEDEAQAHL